jgi:RNA polymerase primary sigma factor
MNKVTATTRKLQRLGAEPDVEEIAKRTGLSLKKVRAILKIEKDPVSLETPVGEGEEDNLGDFINDRLAPSPLDLVIRKELQAQIIKLMGVLTEREAEVIKRRFGIGYDSSQTLEEIGMEFKVTKERIRQIEGSALKKLRHPARSKLLKSFMEI